MSAALISGRGVEPCALEKTNMLVPPDAAAIAKSVIGLAHDLKIDVGAEGVETQEQLDYLRRANCNEA